MKSMLKMQRIQPQIKSIQEKYKKYSMRDPRKQDMNKEIMDVQRQAGVSPLGGCLPMVIQLPFLFAYYGMLGSALDLRHASWLWIKDLSSPDPFYLIPIGIVVSMFIMQRMTPQTGHGSGAAKNDDLDDADDVGHYEFQFAFRAGTLLVGGQPDRNRAAIDHEPHEPGTRNARDRGQAGAQERQITFRPSSEG